MTATTSGNPAHNQMKKKNEKVVYSMRVVLKRTLWFNLAAKLEVAHYNGDLSAGDDQDDEDQKEETEQVVELMQPNGRPDEEQLDEDCPKGQHPTHQNGKERLHVPAENKLKRFKWLTHSFTLCTK